MYTIFITEKPSVAQEYKKVLKVNSDSKTDGYIMGHSSVLNKDVIITWAVGHLIALGSPDEQMEQKRLPKDHKPSRWKKDVLPIIPDNWIYKENGATYSQYKIVKSLYTRDDIECIYYAGDSGREGIYIQALIRNQIFKNITPPFEERVVWIDSYTDESIINGIKDAKKYSEYKNMIDSGYARAWTDWLIGMNLTQAFTLTSGGLVTVGRVMTPTLSILAKRQEEVENFKPHSFYGIKSNEGASWKVCESSEYYESNKLYNENAFDKKDDAVNFMNSLSKRLVVDNVKETPKKEYAPLLFNLADLQATCSRLYSISPTQTLSIAQSLYEKKMTTYPRTDARYLSSAVANDLKAKGKYIPNKYINDDAITDHYAIIPTGHKADVSGLEEKVYNLIKKRFDDISKPPFEYIDIVTTFFDGNEMFVLSQKEVTNSGFKDVETNSISRYTKGQTLNTDYSLYEGETKPKPMFTSGSLITEMEKCGKNLDDKEARDILKGSGIGTSATRSNIIDKLKQKGFIDIDSKQKITVTNAGKSILPIISKYDERLVSPIKTADMEQKLADMVEGKISQDDYMQEVISYITETVNSILDNNTDKIEKSFSKGKEIVCPCCGKPMDYGKFGYYHKDKSCSFNIANEVCGAKITEKDVDSILKNGYSTVKSMTSKAGKKFKAKLKLNKEEKKFDFEFVQSKKNFNPRPRAKEVYYR